MNFSFQNYFIICLLFTFQYEPVESRQGRWVKRKMMNDLFTVQSILQFKRQWMSFFDRSHLKPKLNSNFDQEGPFNYKISNGHQWKPYISIGNQIARKRGDLAPLQSYLLFQDFDSALIKSNTHRAQLMG